MVVFVSINQYRRYYFPIEYLQQYREDYRKKYGDVILAVRDLKVILRKGVKK